jgi:hypothetical protein
LVSDDLQLLMGLRVQGITSPERAAAALCSDTAAAAVRLASLADSGLAVERTGRLSGFTITPAGVERLEELLASEGLRGSDDLESCYETFLRLNPKVLKISSDWQVRRESGNDVPNDHSDAAYDYSVVERLCKMHMRARDCMDAIARCASRYSAYGSRLDSCVQRLESGDRTAFTAPLAESYHTVWFELHQDLLLTLGRQREE